MARKEYELTNAVLRYATSCTREGDWSALRDMNIGDREAEALRNLTLGELTLLERKLDGHILRVQLDRAAFWMVLDQVRRESQLQAAKLELVRRNAPAEMMESLFGMGQKEYVACRRSIRAPRGVGRPPEPDEETTSRIWMVWKRVAGDTGWPRPDQWTEIADETGASLRIIWRLAQRWLEEFPPAASGSGREPAGPARLEA